MADGESVDCSDEEAAMNDYFDRGTLFIIALTFVLFGLALFTKGLTHDLLLEAGVFLVSVKLIVMGYKNSIANGEITQELREIKKILKKSQE